MHMMGRIGFMGLGIALVSCLGGAPVFAAEKPTADGQKIMITSPKDGDMVRVCSQTRPPHPKE